MVYVYVKIAFKVYLLCGKHRTNGKKNTFDDVTQKVSTTGVTWQICNGPIAIMKAQFGHILHLSAGLIVTKQKNHSNVQIAKANLGGYSELDIFR